MPNPALALGLFVALAACSVEQAGPLSAPRAVNSQGERALAGKVAGKPVSCISARDADRPIELAGGAVAYRASANLVYVQDFGGSCANVHDSDVYLVRTSPLSQLCRGDIAQAVSRAGNIPIGSCVYADFVPYRAP